jgi:hypothetical protein
VGYCYHSGLEKTLRKWEINVPLVTKWLINNGQVFPGTWCGFIHTSISQISSDRKSWHLCRRSSDIYENRIYIRVKCVQKRLWPLRPTQHAHLWQWFNLRYAVPK